MGTTPPSNRSPFYVRSQHQLAVWNPAATGLKISYEDAVRIYGDDTLQEVAEERAATIERYPDEPGASFRRFREYQGLTLQELARTVGCTVEEVKNAEDNTSSPMRVLILIATYFGIPPLELSWRAFYPAYVRSQDSLAEWRPTSKGPKIPYADAVQLYGTAKLDEVVDKGTAVLTVDITEPAASLLRFREHHGLSIQALAGYVGLTVDEVADAENPATRTSMQVLSAIAMYFDIPPLELSWKKFYPDSRD